MLYAPHSRFGSSSATACLPRRVRHASYNAESRITQVKQGSTVVASYTYDSAGRRVRQNASGVGDFEYLFDLANHPVAALVPGTTNLYYSETYVGNTHLATAWGPTSYLPLTDWLGTERVRTDVNGNSVETCTNLPFGDSLSCSQSLATYGWEHFAGMWRNQETNTDQTLFRQYSSSQGRWLSPDPAGLAATDLSNPQSLNRYAYVLNNPLNWIDPSGLDAANPDCEDDWYASSHAECPGPGGGWGGGIGIGIGIGFGDGGSGTGGANSQPGTPAPTSNGTTFPGNPVGILVCSVITVPGTLDTPQISCTTMPYPTSPGGIAAFFRRIGAYVISHPWQVSWIFPIVGAPGAYGVGPAGNVNWNPMTHTVCIGVGAGASIGDNLSAGPITYAKMFNGLPVTPSNIDKVFSGPSISLGGNLPIGPIPVGPGVQGSINGTGLVAGPTFGVAGASISSTSSFCGSY